MAPASELRISTRVRRLQRHEQAADLGLVGESVGGARGDRRQTGSGALDRPNSSIKLTLRAAVLTPGATLRGSWHHQDVTNPGLTHACARCGAQVPLDVGLCERCNPLGPPGRVELAGPRHRDRRGRHVHRDHGHRRAAPAGGDRAVQGDGRAGRARRRGPGDHADRHERGQQRRPDDLPRHRSRRTAARAWAAFLLSPQVDAGGTLTFTQTVTELGIGVRPLEVECASP